ncbi:hypothetical protein [Chryseolinea sp. H1M3-3]|uniref:hypothetical protein n=1 Tax=Chryseolinea sp. H1M3-3 TaxID=3034144 RepID=UPI0023ECAA3E|nr:hypothetical protein [Chryseolinea sp. H1M3-3]
MDILDNVIFAAYNRSLTGNRPIQSDYVAVPSAPTAVLTNPTSPAPIWTYQVFDKLNFCTVEDPAFIETAIIRHWYDVDAQDIYEFPVASPTDQYSSFVDSSTYHLMYAYLLENTRILQIFERVIERYMNDEELGISNGLSTYNWIHNSERLFFKSDTSKVSNLRSLIRPSADASRRNAYQRMFGMDLAFGDAASQSDSLAYVRSKSSNQQFIVLFERYLSEIWQGYINARNTSGANTSDTNILVEYAQQLQEMMAARRGDTANNTYAHLNLSREEYSSVLMTSWFSFIISYDSPVVNYLSCQSSTIGERLIKIGNKVGIQAHRKCQSLFEMAGSAATILLAIETTGLLDDSAWVGRMLSSLNPPVPTPLSIEGNFMNAFLTVINNWEKATGHKIKNPEANVMGTVKVQPASNGASLKQKVALN